VKKLGSIALRLNNFLYNAGILGLLKVFEYCRIPLELYQVNGSELVISPEIFTSEKFDFPRMYYETLKYYFEDGTVWKKIVDLEFDIERLNISNDEGKEIFDKLIKKEIIDTKCLERSSYRSGYDIVKQKDDEFDVISSMNMLKKETDYIKKKDILLIIIRYIKKYHETFCFKDMSYTKINQFWSDMAFLNRQSNKKDMLECYESVFCIPVYKYLLTSKNKLQDFCLDCGNPIKMSDAFGMSWINGVGVDHRRKKSYFWNSKPDSFLCPVCALVYSCSPLGFVFAKKKNDSVFINNNTSIEELKRNNEGFTSEVIGNLDNLAEVCFNVTNRLIQKELELKESELQNIQVIIRNDSGYNIGIISREKLIVIKECENSFRRLTERRIKNQDNWISVYENVLNNLLSGRNQYIHINMYFRISLREKQSSWYIWDVLRIQIWKKGGNCMDEFKRSIVMAKFAKEIRSKIAGNSEEADNKLRGFAYKLLNSLQAHDRHRFMNVIIRMYTGLGLQIPQLFLKMFENDDTFMNLGYAFILGLKGEEYNPAENIKKEA